MTSIWIFHLCFSDILQEMGDPLSPDFPMDDPPPYRECNTGSDILKTPDTDSTKSTDGEITESTPLNNTFRWEGQGFGQVHDEGWILRFLDLFIDCWFAWANVLFLEAFWNVLTRQCTIDLRIQLCHLAADKYTIRTECVISMIWERRTLMISQLAKLCHYSTKWISVWISE